MHRAICRKAFEDGPEFLSLRLPFYSKDESMIFTIAHIQALSAVRFEAADRELLVEFAPAHPGNQRRTLQIRFGSEAARELIEAILTFDSECDHPLRTPPIE
jgi:hypothetical protein